VTCLSNLGQIGHAMLMYNADNRENFPAAAWLPPNNLTDDWIYWEPGRSFGQGRLMPYIGSSNTGVLRCPSDDYNSHKNYPNDYRYSYSVNEFICNTLNRMPPTKPLTLSINIRNPAQKILVVDENSQTIDDGCWWASSPTLNGLNVLSNRHYMSTEDKSNFTSGRGNVAFADGHASVVERVDAMTPAFYDPTLP